MHWDGVPGKEVLAYAVSQMCKYCVDTNNYKDCGEHGVYFQSSCFALEILKKENDKPWKPEGIHNGV